MINCTSNKTSATSSGTSSSGSSWVACSSDPSKNSTGTASTSAGVSHRAGQNCLTCHTGSPKAFTVAGSFVTAADSKTFVTNGSGGSPFVTVNTVQIPVDSCGNFYSTTTTFINGSTTTTSSTGGAMSTTALLSANGDGSCNRSGCHDSGASGNRSYIH